MKSVTKDMLKPFLSRSPLFALLGTFASIGINACSNTKAANLPNPTASALPASPVVSVAELPEKPKRSLASASVLQPQSPQSSKTYQQAIDIATGANTISKSAVSREDWSLVASEWQRAINVLKAVPASSNQHKTARKKLSEYQNYLADAKLRATPPPSNPAWVTQIQCFSPSLLKAESAVSP